MFGFVYEMLGGAHDELPRRRGPAITYDAAEGAFMAKQTDLDDVGHAPWLGRGEVPGQAAADPTMPVDGLTVADEARELMKRPPR